MRQAESSADSVHRLSDAELVRRAQVGRSGKEAAGPAGRASGAAAICELYDRYQNQIFRYLWSRLPDRETAEDLAGEVFTRMVAGLPKYQAMQAPFPAWLYRIARNLLIDHYRKNGKQVEFSLEQVDHLGTDAGDPAGTIEGRLFVERVRVGLQGLHPSEQEVIVLRFFIGLSLQETASILGKTVGAVKIAQHRGLSELRTVLKREAVEERDNDS